VIFAPLQEAALTAFDVVIPLTGARILSAEHAAKLEGICP